MTYRILQGDNRDLLKTIESNSIDSIVCDPPYGIDFLGKKWDADTGSLETYQECLRVLKPGGYIAAFSAARTYHYLAITIERAGFEIRDQIMWIYSSGFPKSQDVGRQLHKKAHGKPDKQRFDPSIMIRIDADRYSHPDNGKIYRALPDINGDRLEKSHEGQKYGIVYEEVIEVLNEWSGWGSALKPAHEPICLARKPSKLSIAQNVQRWGTGALNIDAARIPIEGQDTRSGGSNGWDRVEFGEAEPNKYDGNEYVPNAQGRFPSNVIGEIAEPYQKYFYCPKVSRAERHMGYDLSNIPTDPGGMLNNKSGTLYNADAKKLNVGNNHPTVKPIDLMKYLIKLITPPGGTVLDPFNGSGSTGIAAVLEDFEYIGLELDPAYVEISRRRIEAALKPQSEFRRLFDCE